MQRISLKQLGDDILEYIGGQVTLKYNLVTSWNTSITINGTDVKLTSNDELTLLQKQTLKLIQIVDDDNVLKGLAKVVSYDVASDEFKVIAIEYGTGKGKFYIYETSKELSTTITDETTLETADLNNTSVTLSDLDVNQLVYDLKGTVAFISSIDTTSNNFKVKTMTTAKEYMPIAPDVKRLKIKDGGTGYQVGDIVESTTTGVFAEVTEVSDTGKILQVIETTQTQANEHGSDCVIDYEQVIYGGYNDNWAELVDVATLVAQIIGEDFEYLAGYKFTITNAGTGYQVGDILKSTDEVVTMRVTKVDVNGEILEVEWIRTGDVSVNGQDAQIDYSTDDNMFIIPDEYWNMGETFFTFTNEDGASIQFIRNGDILVKYNAGADGKIYKFEYNEQEGYIKQSYITLSGSGTSQEVKEPFNYEEGYKFEVVSGGTDYQIGDVIQVDNVFVEVLGVDGNGEILSVKYTRKDQVSTSGNGADITSTPDPTVFIIPDAVWNSDIYEYEITVEDGASVHFNKEDDTLVKYNMGAEQRIYRFEYDEENGVIYTSYKEIEATSSVSKPIHYLTGYTYEIVNGGTGYQVSDILEIDHKFVKVVDVDETGAITEVDYTRELVANTSGTGAEITITNNPNVYIIPDDYWDLNNGFMYDITTVEGAQAWFYKDDDVLEKYNTGSDNKIYKFVFDNLEGVITVSSQTISANQIEFAQTLPRDATTMKKGTLYVNDIGYSFTPDNNNLVYHENPTHFVTSLPTTGTINELYVNLVDKTINTYSNGQWIVLGGGSNIEFDERANFPIPGDPNTLYIATDENKMYRYDLTNGDYTCLTTTGATVVSYSDIITGNGTGGVNFQLEHNLNTKKLVVSVYDIATGEAVPFELTIVDADRIKIGWGNNLSTSTKYQVDILGWL